MRKKDATKIQSVAANVQPHPDRNAVVINESISIENGYLVFKKDKIALSTITTIKSCRSYFGIRKDTQYETFNYLLNEIWDLTVTRLFHEMKSRIVQGQTVRIGQCRIDNEGILYKEFLITWADLLLDKSLLHGNGKCTCAHRISGLENSEFEASSVIAASTSP